jgi:hypothetical protein
MGISTTLIDSSSLADALFPKVRQRVLAVLFGNPGRSYYANEVIALAQSGTRDYLLSSPSMAAVALQARSANGWIEWKNPQGKTLDEAKRQVLAVAD